jgi:hypothetical protein
MTNSNFFLVNRGLLSSDRWLSEPFTRGQAWVDMFGLAQHSDGFFRVRGIKVSVRRGQLAYSQVTLSERWKWSRGKVKRYLDELEKGGDIVQQNDEVTTLITIVKYDFWQKKDKVIEQQTVQQTDSRRSSNGTHTKNDNNENNVNKPDPILATPEVVAAKDEVNEILSAFQMKLNPTINYGNKTQRDAVKELLKVQGKEKLLRTTEYAAAVSSEQFAPIITTPYQLKEKMAQLIAYYQKQNNKKPHGMNVTVV